MCFLIVERYRLLAVGCCVGFFVARIFVMLIIDLAVFSTTSKRLDVNNRRSFPGRIADRAEVIRLSCCILESWFRRADINLKLVPHPDQLDADILNAPRFQRILWRACINQVVRLSAFPKFEAVDRTGGSDRAAHHNAATAHERSPQCWQKLLCYLESAEQQRLRHAYQNCVLTLPDFCETTPIALGASPQRLASQFTLNYENCQLLKVT